MRSRREGAGSREDLLKQIEGVDGRVTQGVRLRWLGRLGGSLSTALLAYLVRHGWSWWLFAPVGGLAASSFVIAQGRQWIRDARQPFRYTYSVDPFEPVSIPQDRKLNWTRDWIRADLILMLNDRIRRLSLLPQEKVTGDTPEQPAAHIHISGTYGSRKEKGRASQAARPAVEETTPDGAVTIELMPHVRIGSDACSAAVAYAVRFEVPKLPDLKEERVKYDHILERVYFNVATQIYRQIREDVKRKIAHLPTAYLRATAYFNEAEDYARSNTLDAFNDAGKLYEKALDLFDRTRISLPQPPLRRPYALLRQSLAPKWQVAALRLAYVLPRFGRREVHIARAETGYAKVLLFRNILASLSGRESKRIFEARRYARRAVDRLRPVPDGIPDRDDAYFEARLIAAFAEHWSGDIVAASEELKEARDLRPATAEGHVLFPFVAGSLEPRLHRKVRLLRRAVELHPRFEIAHFELAFSQEQLWRSGDELDEVRAGIVKQRYETVTRLFPANLTAWANLGYVRWLLWDSRRAEEAELVLDAFEGGRRYKEIREEAMVAELDHGMARVLAEQGKLGEAYERFVVASQANMAQETLGGYPHYWFDRINEDILDRFRRYLETVEQHVERQAKQVHPPPRWLDAVRAYALTDWGNACAAYYLRSGDERYRKQALEALDRAVEANPRYVLARHSRAVVLTRSGTASDLKQAELDLLEARRLEPRWLPAQLDLVRTKVALARERGDEHDVEEAQKAAKDLLTSLPRSPADEGLTGDGDPVLALGREELDERRRRELVETVTGPIADSLVAWLQARELLTDEKARQDAARVCRFVQEECLPGDRTVLELGRKLGKPDDDAVAKLDLLDREIVQRQLDSDPAHCYWLGQLVDPLPALREAARWPGAAPALLDWISKTLAAHDSETSDHAAKRAAARRAELKDRATARLVEERLEDGDFDDGALVRRLAPLVRRLLDDPKAQAQSEAVHEVPGIAFPLAYAAAFRREDRDAQDLLVTVVRGEDASSRRASIAAAAILQLVARSGWRLGGAELQTLVEKMPWLVKPLQVRQEPHRNEVIDQLLLDRLRSVVEEQQARARV